MDDIMDDSYMVCDDVAIIIIATVDSPLTDTPNRGYMPYNGH